MHISPSKWESDPSWVHPPGQTWTYSCGEEAFQLDLIMFATFGRGTERTEREFCELASEAGFSGGSNVWALEFIKWLTTKGTQEHITPSPYNVKFAACISPTAVSVMFTNRLKVSARVKYELCGVSNALYGSFPTNHVLYVDHVQNVLYGLWLVKYPLHY
jgi:hypothetical protein